jgi:hypothetical protein
MDHILPARDAMSPSKFIGSLASSGIAVIFTAEPAENAEFL